MTTERFLWCGKFLFNEQREKTSDSELPILIIGWHQRYVRAKRYLLEEWMKRKKHIVKKNKLMHKQSLSRVHLPKYKWHQIKKYRLKLKYSVKYSWKFK